ncbi:hypothetical protein FHS28_004649 [Roseateles terrae]|uniref:Uncharacterized protein n=1 Tax=Roseateles terrae TaxID=431060 RepID=A0ABR6GYM5_9BURK|nr:hypothetical protein [Roseateles terrae]
MNGCGRGNAGGQKRRSISQTAGRFCALPVSTAEARRIRRRGMGLASSPSWRNDAPTPVMRSHRPFSRRAAASPDDCVASPSLVLDAAFWRWFSPSGVSA